MEEKKQATKYDSLKAKYGKLYLVSTTIVDDNGEEQEKMFGFKKPSAADYDRFIQDASKKPTQAFKNLVTSSVVEEDQVELVNTIEEHPGAPTSLAKELLRLLGVTDKVNLIALSIKS